jgi:hypothetical protein
LLNRRVFVIAAWAAIEVLIAAIGTEKPTFSVDNQVGRGTRGTACGVLHRGDYTPWNLPYFQADLYVVTFDGLERRMV